MHKHLLSAIDKPEVAKRNGYEISLEFCYFNNWQFNYSITLNFVTITTIL